MLNRNVYNDLKKWKNSTGKKTCLLLGGVRQCGKTFIVREFGRQEYESFVEINFIMEPRMKDVFSGNIEVNNIIKRIKLLKPSASFIPGKTLLFLDEIQDCPEARTSLKFFAEDRQYDVIASGSLLGVGFGDVHSIPVGYESRIRMYPLDFHEFLWANGIDEDAISDLKKYSDGLTKVNSAVDSTLIEKLREYMVVGGLPDAVNEYIASGDYASVHEVQERILMDYQDDIAKYTESGDRIKAKQCFLSIPKQLTKDNHKFQYSVVEKRGTARKFANSIDWLTASGMIYVSNNVNTPSFPLKAYSIDDQFRIYLCDIGLYNAMFGYQMKEAIISDKLTGPAKGSDYEALIADIFSKKGYKLYYYKRADSTLEIEFLLEKDAEVVPVEVKAKKGPTKSLNEILKDDNITAGYKLSNRNTGREDKKIILPLYMAMFL